MPLSLALYEDAGLTTLKAGNIVATQAADGTTGPLTFLYYLGSTVANRKFESRASPGIEDIELSIVDTTPGVGHLPNEVKLASSLVGLDGAVGGVSLNLGPVLNSGVVNATPIYIRVDAGVGAVGTFTELAIETQELIESVV